MPIKGFKDSETKKVFNGQFPKKLPQSIQKVARVRLKQLHFAERMADLSNPGHQLEAMTDDRKGQHSIRINQQWHVCFIWNDGEPEKVEITDPH